MWGGQAFVYSADHGAKLEESELAVAVHANQISLSTEAFVPPSLHRPMSQKPVWVLDTPIEIGNELSHRYIQAFFFSLFLSGFAPIALFVPVAAWLQSSRVCPFSSS